MIIGITGKSGSGKSYIAEILAEKLKANHLDIDKISHAVLNFPESMQFLKAEFGSSVFAGTKIDTKAIGKIVFNDKSKLQKLNDFCKKLIEKQLDDIINFSKNPIIIDYALLCGLRQFDSCDIKILLKTDFETRFERVFKREQISKDYFSSRDKSIDDYDESKFDYVFENISNEQINEILTTLKAKLGDNND